MVLLSAAVGVVVALLSWVVERQHVKPIAAAGSTVMTIRERGVFSFESAAASRGRATSSWACAASSRWHRQPCAGSSS